MNSLTQSRKISILPLLIALALVVVAPARATPSCRVNTVILALEHFQSGSLDLMCNEFDSYGWFLKTIRGTATEADYCFCRKLAKTSRPNPESERSA